MHGTDNLPVDLIPCRYWKEPEAASERGSVSWTQKKTPTKTIMTNSALETPTHVLVQAQGISLSDLCMKDPALHSSLPSSSP